MKKVFLGIIFIVSIGILSACMVTENYDEYERKQFHSTDEISEIIAKDSSTNYSIQVSDTEEILVEYTASIFKPSMLRCSSSSSIQSV